MTNHPWIAAQTNQLLLLILSILLLLLLLLLLPPLLLATAWVLIPYFYQRTLQGNQVG